MATRVAGNGGGGQMRGAVSPGGGEARSVQVMTVAEVLVVDRSGRFVVVRSGDIAGNSDVDAVGEGDGEDQVWMLINTDPQARKSTTGTSRSDSSSRLSSVQPGRTVNVKGGGSMSWDLNMEVAQNHVVSKEGPVKCKVAVLWDVTNNAR